MVQIYSDHTFEYIESAGIDYIDTGGTHVCDLHTDHNATIPENSLIFHGCEDGGFTRIQVDKTGMGVYYYFGSDTNVKYTVPTRNSRHMACYFQRKIPKKLRAEGDVHVFLLV